MKLTLGVIDHPYVDYAKGKKKKTAANVSTGDVAEILEEKYHVMETFVKMHEGDIAKAMEGGLAGSLESLLMGAPVALDPFGTAMGDIKKMFNTFLDTREMEKAGIPGVPTKAALDGVNHRLKSGKGKRRPSFIDTGQYQNAFIAEVS